MNARSVVEGRVIAHRDGYGFLARDDGGEDLFLPAREMRGLMHGDRVACEVRVSRRGGGRLGPGYRGVVLEVLERNHQVVVGRFFPRGRHVFRFARPPEPSSRRGDPGRRGEGRGDGGGRARRAPGRRGPGQRANRAHRRALGGPRTARDGGGDRDPFPRDPPRLAGGCARRGGAAPSRGHGYPRRPDPTSATSPW